MERDLLLESSNGFRAAKGITGDALELRTVGGKLVDGALELGGIVGIVLPLLLLRLSSGLAELVPLLGITGRPLAPATDAGYARVGATDGAALLDVDRSPELVTGSEGSDLSDLEPKEVDGARAENVSRVAPVVEAREGLLVRGPAGCLFGCRPGVPPSLLALTVPRGVSLRGRCAALASGDPLARRLTGMGGGGISSASLGPGPCCVGAVGTTGGGMAAGSPICARVSAGSLWSASSTSIGSMPFS